MSRIALYWHNGRSLGHTKRSFNIGNAIIRQFPDYAVMGITGAFRGLEQSPEGMDIVKLPSHRTYETLDGHYSKPLLKIPQNTLKELRESLISTFVKKFKPETMLVDYLPLGKNRELILIFEDKLIPKKFLGFRGIMDLPERTNSDFFDSETTDFIVNNYDSIFVYTDPDMFGWKNFIIYPGPLQTYLNTLVMLSRNRLFQRLKLE